MFCEMRSADTPPTIETMSGSVPGAPPSGPAAPPSGLLLVDGVAPCGLGEASPLGDALAPPPLATALGPPSVNGSLFPEVSLPPGPGTLESFAQAAARTAMASVSKIPALFTRHRPKLTPPLHPRRRRVC
jgi:hypothetical protein